MLDFFLLCLSFRDTGRAKVDFVMILLVSSAVESPEIWRDLSLLSKWQGVNSLSSVTKKQVPWCACEY